MPLRVELLEPRHTPAVAVAGLEVVPAPPPSPGLLPLPPVPDNQFAAPPSIPIPANAIVTGASPGQLPYVTIRNSDGSEIWSIATMDYTPTDTPIPGAPSPPFFAGGVRVALGDVTGDGVPDAIAAAGPGGGPRVQVFDGTTYQEVRSFFAYDPGFRGGVFLAAGDVTGDGVDDIVTGAGAGGGPHVKAFDGKTGAEVRSFYAYDPGFTGGVNVAVASHFQATAEDGIVTSWSSWGDIVTGAGAGGGPHVKTFDGTTIAEKQSFYAFDPGFIGGVDVAVTEYQDVSEWTDTGAGGLPARFTSTYTRPFLLAAAMTSGGSTVNEFVYETGDLLRTLEPFVNSTSGVRVAARRFSDTDNWKGDSLIVAAGPGGGPRVRVYPFITPSDEETDFFAGDRFFTGGVEVG